MNFKAHIIDTGLPGGRGGLGQTAAVDLDGCGRPEFVMGRSRGDIYAYKYHAPDRWTRYLVGRDSPSDVGACVLDVDGDGRPDIVTGGAWYRNPGSLDVPFERIVFDADLDSVHDVAVADLTGDGRMEVITMSDRNNLRWYRIPDDPYGPWERHDVGPAVHAGVAVGDIDGNGLPDIVRTDVWFRNAGKKGAAWEAYPAGQCTPPPPDFRVPFAWNATSAVVCDVNRDGKNDIVFSDAEIPGGKIWWMENRDGRGTDWVRHEIAVPDGRRRGAYHGLHAGDLCGNGHIDVLACEMEAVPGDGSPRWYVWENLDGKGGAWREHVIFDGNLGGHNPVVADFTGNGKPDVISKPWKPRATNAVGGKDYVVFLENIG